MPRGAKKPPNQHNARHENGVVAPGKRLTKQKSNGHLNGGADVVSHSPAPPPPTSSSAHTTSQLPENYASGTLSNATGGLQGAGELDMGKTSSGDSSEVVEGLPNRNSHISGLAEYGKIDFSTAKYHATRPTHNDNLFSLALTVLRSCPLGDTIAILMFLLSLPSTMLTITNALFAMLTFMPPTGSFSSIPTTFNDIFQGSGGTPSVATIFLTDIIGLILWLVIWQPVQSLAIELAQAIVASTLGGGNTGKKSGNDSTLLCMSMVTISYGFHHEWIPRTLFGYDWPAVLSRIPYVSKSQSSFLSHDDYMGTRSAAGWLRVLVALHILIQGLVHVARRWYTKREYSQAIPVKKKIDAEATAGSPIRPSAAPSPESGSQPLSNPTQDLTPKTTSASTKDSREKLSSTKKKRKQGTYVRSQQPLWAAFAATKVTIMREYEQSHVQSEATKLSATDTNNLGDTPSMSDTARICVAKSFPTSFTFDTGHLPVPERDNQSATTNDGSGIDRSKPFYVRINDTDWPSTRLERRPLDDSAGQCWTGEVFGLSPSSTYRCSFVQSKDGVVFRSIILTTPPLLIATRGTMAPPRHSTTWFNIVAESSTPSVGLPPLAHRPSSPTSPTTTLSRSLAAFDGYFTDLQVRLKRGKKDSKAASTSLKKDIDVFNSKTSKAGGEEKVHLARHLQWDQLSKQAEDAVASISGEIESTGCIPEDEVAQAKGKKSSWDEARGQQNSTREEMFRGKDFGSRDKSIASNEASTAQQKKDRLVARKAKLNEQHERLESATSKGVNEKERKNSEQAARDLEHVQAERRDHEQMSIFQRMYEELRYWAHQYWQQIQLVEGAYNQQQDMSNMVYSEQRPLTPEGDLPGTNPQNSAAAPAFRFPPPFGTPDPPSSLRSHSGSLRYGDTRPRSTSMLSGNGVYADFDDQDPAPPMPVRAVEAIRERDRCKSGGSGSASSESPRDPASPIVGKATQGSPVGKRSPVWNQ